MQQERFSILDGGLEQSSLQTVEEARRQLVDSLRAGGSECPCCGAQVKPYRVTITKNMLRELRWAVDNSNAVVDGSIFPQQAKFVDFADAPDDIRASRTISKLRYFGLVEKKLRIDLDGSEREVQGCWRPTAKGIRFALGMLSLRTRALVFRGETLDQLGEKESAADIMSRGTTGDEVRDEP